MMNITIKQPSLVECLVRPLILTLICLLSMTFASAENYPYRSDYLFTTIPNHADWLYKVGEKAEVEVIFQLYGVNKTVECEYSIENDMAKHTEFKKITLKDGRGKINMGTRKTPGFNDLMIRTNLNGKSVSHHIKVGYDVDKIQAWTKEPADFKSFWDGVLKEQQKTKLSYTKTLAKEYCTDKFDCYLVKLQLVDNHAMYGYLFIPLAAKQGKKCPVVLCPPGAGIKTIKEPLRHRYYAENDMIRFEIEIHGLNPTMSDEQFKEISNAFNENNGGYMANGIENPNRMYLKHVYAGMVRCFDFLTSLPEWDGKNCAVQGGSQGGALSIIAAALDPRVNICVANHPALSDMGAYSADGVTEGWPHFNANKLKPTKEVLSTLAYYDVVNFAKYVKADTYMTWGYNDNTCPPTTSYAVWNNFTCPKESLITPVNEHWTSENTEYGHMVWIKNHLK